jgi:hypothetical protein
VAPERPTNISREPSTIGGEDRVFEIFLAFFYDPQSTFEGEGKFRGQIFAGFPLHWVFIEKQYGSARLFTSQYQRPITIFFMSHTHLPKFLST